MDEFNPKKARAHKLRMDKHHGKPKKPIVGCVVPSAGKNKIPLESCPNSSRQNEKPKETKAQSSDEEEIEVHIPKFSKRKVASNWDRYEEALEHNTSDQDHDNCGAQFEELLSMPISSGHMKLKHEHAWEKEKSELQLPWFQLDIQSLEKNLSTITFQKRQDLASSIFSEAQLQRMAVRAKQNITTLNDESLLKVQNLILGRENSKEEHPNRQISSDKKILQNKDHACPTQEESDDIDDLLVLHETSSKPLIGTFIKAVVSPSSGGDPIIEDLPELRNSPHPSVSVNASTAAASNQHSGSLDDWLDSILDD